MQLGERNQQPGRENAIKQPLKVTLHPHYNAWDAFTVHYYVEQITLPAELLMSASMNVGTVQKKG